jgi:hypothetical protein
MLSAGVDHNVHRTRVREESRRVFKTRGHLSVKEKKVLLSFSWAA